MPPEGAELSDVKVREVSLLIGKQPANRLKVLLTKSAGGKAAAVKGAEAIANYTDVYMTSFYVVMGFTALLVCLIPLLRRWTAGVR